MQPTRSNSSHETTWWVSTVATLSICLWASNFVLVQNVEYKLTTSVAISQHRLPILERLKTNGKVGASKDAVGFSILEIKLSDSDLLSNSSSELSSARITVKLSERRLAEKTEQNLDLLTTPTSETIECIAFANQMRMERWFLETSQHSLKRLELDLEHDKYAIDTNELAETSEEELIASYPNSPFRLTSFTSRSTLDDSNMKIRERLKRLSQSQADKVDSMLLTLERLKANARGFLSFTGSSQIVPVVHSISIIRFCLICLLCLAVWLLSIWWARPVSFGNGRTRHSLASQSRRNAKHASLDKTLGWMQSAGIPYLGSVQIEGEIPMQEVKGLKSERDLVTADSNEQVDYAANGGALRLLRSVGEGSLVMWVGLFGIRMAFDSTWRELVLTAPLAAISRMIFGIQ